MSFSFIQGDWGIIFHKHKKLIKIQRLNEMSFVNFNENMSH